MQSRPRSGPDRDARPGPPAAGTGPRAAAEGLRILYVGVGNRAKVASGLDRVLAIHLGELQRGPAEVTAFVVNPEASAETREQIDRLDLTTVPNGLDGRRSLSAWLFKLGLLMEPQTLVNGATLARPALRRRIRDAIVRVEPHVMVIDHIYAAQNVGWRDLVSPRLPLVFVSHDYTPDLIGDFIAESRSWRRRLMLTVDRFKARWLERLIVRQAARIVFLSGHDRDRYPEARARSAALLPLDGRSEVPPTEQHDGSARTVVFIGSPRFVPNRWALDWICDKLAGPLSQADPSCSILLIGKGTETYSSPAGNVRGLGFVGDNELSRLLADSLALISPIEHGSGLKIKILDALTSGVPVIATDHSFRGFSGFQRIAVLRTTDPEACARDIAALDGEPVERAARRGTVLASLYRMQAARKGALLEIISSAVETAANNAETAEDAVKI